MVAKSCTVWDQTIIKFLYGAFIRKTPWEKLRTINFKVMSWGQLAQGKIGRFVNLRFKGTLFDSRLCQDFFKCDNINSQFKA